MIELSIYEKQWIKLCKGQYEKLYPFQKTWHETAKPLFEKIYGWNPDKNSHYQDYLNHLFEILLDLYLKIKEEYVSENHQLKMIFHNTFYKRISCNEELPIERAIHTLCALIQGTTVIENGVKRLDI